MKVRCIDNRDYYGNFFPPLLPYITEGRIYNVINETDYHYEIINDNKKNVVCTKNRFEIIKEKIMRLDLKEFSNLENQKQKLKEGHIYVATQDGYSAILFCAGEKVFRFNKDSGTFVAPTIFYEEEWTIIADVTDRVKISL